LIGTRFDGDSSTVALDYLSADRKSNSGSLIVLSVKALEDDEYSLEMLWSDALAVV